MLLQCLILGFNLNKLKPDSEINSSPAISPYIDDILDILSCEQYVKVNVQLMLHGFILI